VAQTVAYFTAKLEAVASKYAHLFEKSVGVGLMRGLRAKSAQIQTACVQNAMQEGLVLLKAGRNTVRFLPSITISKDEIDEGFRRFETVLDSL
jgi:acetylornithine aminotransferase